MLPYPQFPGTSLGIKRRQQKKLVLVTDSVQLSKNIEPFHYDFTNVRQ